MLAKAGIEADPHGIARATFRTWCSESGVDRDIAEAALAHSKSGVEAAYDRSKLFNRRIPLMQSWADHATGAAAPRNVVQLRA